MFKSTIANSDLLLSKSYWWGTQWLPYRNLSEEVRVLRTLERDAVAKAAELTHLRTVAETNVNMDMKVLSHTLNTNSNARFEFPTEPSILEERDGIKYNNQKQHNKQGASSNKDQHSKPQGSTQTEQKKPQGNHQQGQQNKQPTGKGRSISILELLTGKIVMH